jgi:hypothetical protein
MLRKKTIYEFQQTKSDSNERGRLMAADWPRGTFSSLTELMLVLEQALYRGPCSDQSGHGCEASGNSNRRGLFVYNV